jgi:hypothetical protein
MGENEEGRDNLIRQACSIYERAISKQKAQIEHQKELIKTLQWKILKHEEEERKNS